MTTQTDTPTKNLQFSFELTEADKEQLEAICQHHDRSGAAQLRVLIRQEFARIYLQERWPERK